MSVAAAVTLAVAVLAVLAIVTFLVGIAMILAGVNSRLKKAIAAVSAIADSTEPVAPLVSSINRDLGAAREMFESLLEREAARAGDPVVTRGERAPRRS